MSIPRDEAECAARIIREDPTTTWVIPTRMLEDILAFCRSYALDWKEVEQVIFEELTIRGSSGLKRVLIGGACNG